MKKTSIIIVLTLILLLSASFVQADTPVVQAILFYSPTCPHCHDVIDNVLPPLKSEYGDQLQLLGVDTSKADGQTLYLAAIEQYDVPDDSHVVPILYIGDVYLIGGAEIAEEFPIIIDSGLSNGGIGWPEIPGLFELIPNLPPSAGTTNNPDAVEVTEEGSLPEIDIEEISSDNSAAAPDDPLGKGIAWVVLIGMIIALIIIAALLIRKNRDGWNLEKLSRSNAIPILSILGTGVASYLAYVEITSVKAVCGPVGECNIVQSSEYARLFGIPIAVWGLLFYLLILGIWLVMRTFLNSKPQWLGPVLIVASIFGTLFSIYLTYLEIFVIGAVCAWCLTSAVLTTLIMVFMIISLTTDSDEKVKEPIPTTT